MRNRRWLTVVSCMMAAAVGCGGTKSPTTPSGEVLTGRFGGVATDSTTTAPDSWDWQLTQTGTSFTGLMTACVISNCPSGFRYQGTISGTVTGGAMTFTVSVPDGGVGGLPGCTMSLSGTGAVKRVGGVSPATTVDGTYQGTQSCGGSITGGTFFVSRPD